MAGSGEAPAGDVSACPCTLLHARVWLKRSQSCRRRVRTRRGLGWGEGHSRCQRFFSNAMPHSRTGLLSSKDRVSHWHVARCKAEL
eukprot:3938910-Rhodomonas_salina.8